LILITLQISLATRDDLLSLKDCIQVLTHGIEGMVRNTNEILQRRFGQDSSQRNHNSLDDGSDADVEENYLPPRKVTWATKHHAHRQNKLAVSIEILNTLMVLLTSTLQSDVRLHTQRLMEERNSHLSAHPTIGEVHAFEHSPEPTRACTAQDFRPDVTATPATPWNKSVTEVFVESFLDADVYECRNPHKIQLAFVSHLKHLQRTWKLGAETQETREKQAQKARREERKRNVFSTSCQLCEFYDNLGHLALQASR